MSLTIKINEPKQSDRFLVMLFLGTLDSLLGKHITVEEAEQNLFTPYSCERLKEQGISQPVIDLFESACELSDIESIVPDDLQTEIYKLILEAKRLLTELPASPPQKWL